MEIRRLILQEILEPGEVQVRPQPDVNRIQRQRALRDLFNNQPECPLSAHHLQDIDSERRPGPSSHPGYQILATCRQAYEEGVEGFYTKNTFYLPPGPVEHSIHYFDCLTPTNRVKIKTIGVRFGIEDLVPITTPQKDVVLDCDDKWTAAWKTGEPEESLSYYCDEKLREIWFQKLSWIRNWNTVRIAKLEFLPLGKALHIKGDQLGYYLEDVDVNPFTELGDWAGLYGMCFNYSGSALAMTSEAASAAHDMIQAKIKIEGWMKCREWIIAQQKT